MLFTDEEMRNGCVEPKDGGARKPPLDQYKINMIKSKYSGILITMIIKILLTSNCSTVILCLLKYKGHHVCDRSVGCETTDLPVTVIVTSYM